MLTAEQNETLSRVGPGTPMGKLMRRYWVPALLAWELPEPDCPPLEVRLLGENLVAFRDTEGRVGLVSAYCAHRRASLFWGRNEESGIRCVYHGWKFDVAGRCIDMPSEPTASNFKDRVQIPAYPTYEVAGVVWAYMGPPEKQPAPPLFEWTQVSAEVRGMSKVWQENNWLQALEGGIDLVHSAFLHAGRPPGFRYDSSTTSGRGMNISRAAVLEVVPTEYGYAYAGMRTLGDEGNHVRAYHWIPPWTQLRASGRQGVAGHMWVPMDDYNTMVFNWNYSYGPEGTLESRNSRRYEGPVNPLWFRDSKLPAGTANEFGLDVDPDHDFRPTRNRSNKFLIDRQVQKTQTYTGIEGVNNQDRAVQGSMGLTADRSLERLGTTDRAIIAARRILLKAIEINETGGDPPGVAPIYYKLRPIDRVLPHGVPWFEALKAEMYQLEEPQAVAN